jgi:hypothetical protein
MDADRKYSQRGYQDSSRPDRRNGNGNGAERPKPQGPRPSIDITGPRLPRLVQNVTAARCFNCSTMLPPGTDFTGTCPKCNAQLHCCKQCAHFEPSTRFQCVKPIPVRIPLKDQKNECALFTPRVTVARDTLSGGSGNGRSAGANIMAAPPRNASDAKSAFERLFKK